MPGATVEDGDLKITPYLAMHPPIEPGVGYRIDNRDRSVVVSDDSNVSGHTMSIIDGADLLLHDALSVPITSALSKALGAAGQSRQSRIVSDVLDYHASAESLIALGKNSNVDMVAFYHLVPVPPTSLLKSVFMRGAPDNFLLTEDLMWFELPIGGDDINVNIH